MLYYKKILLFLLIFFLCILFSSKNIYAEKDDFKLNEEELTIIDNFIRDFFIGLQNKNYLQLNKNLINKEEIDLFTSEKSILDITIIDGYKYENKYFIKLNISLEGENQDFLQYFYIEKNDNNFKLSVKDFYKNIIEYDFIFTENQDMFKTFYFILNKEWSKVKPLEIKDDISDEFNYLSDTEINKIIDSDDTSKLKEDFYYKQLLAIYNNPFILNIEEVETIYKDKDYYLLDSSRYILSKELISNQSVQLKKLNLKEKVFNSQINFYLYYGYDFDNKFYILNLNEKQKEHYMFSFINENSPISIQDALQPTLEKFLSIVKNILYVTIGLMVLTFMFKTILPVVLYGVNNESEPKNEKEDENNSTVSNLSDSVNSIINDKKETDTNYSRENLVNVYKKSEVNNQIVKKENRNINIENETVENKNIDIETKRKVDFDE